MVVSPVRGGWGGRLGGQWYPLGGGWRGVSGVPCEGGLGVSGVPSSGVWGGGGASGVPCEWGLWEFCCVPDEEGLGVVVVSVLFPGGGCLWCPLRRVLGRVRVGSYRRVWGGPWCPIEQHGGSAVSPGAFSWPGIGSDPRVCAEGAGAWQGAPGQGWGLLCSLGLC